MPEFSTVYSYVDLSSQEYLCYNMWKASFICKVMKNQSNLLRTN